MTQPIQLIAEIYAVEVPDDARNFRFGKSERLKGKLFYNTTLDYFAASQVIELPPGNWLLICSTKEVKDEEAAAKIIKVGEHIPFGFAYDYLRSLLTSKGLDINKNYVLIRKQ